jgi:hypothetical protein
MSALYNDEEARKTQCELTRDDSTTHDIEFVQYQPRSAEDDFFILFYHQSVREFFLGELGQIRPNVPGMLFSEEELDMSAAFAS